MAGTSPLPTAALAQQVDELRRYVRRLEARGEELAALLRERERVTVALLSECAGLETRNNQMQAQLASKAHRAADRVAGLVLRVRRLVRRA